MENQQAVSYEDCSPASIAIRMSSHCDNGLLMGPIHMGGIMSY